MLLFIHEQSLIDFIASLNLSELVALSDKMLNEDTIISKFPSFFYEDFDHFQTSWEVTPSSEQTLLNLKFLLIKKILKIKKHLLNENIAATSVFYFYTSNPRDCLPIHFPHGHSHSLPISGRGFFPSSRGMSSSYYGAHFLHDHRPFQPSSRYFVAMLAHLKQHTHCIEYGAYGQWCQECHCLISICHIIFLLHNLQEIIVHLVFILLTLLRHYNLFLQFPQIHQKIYLF